MVSKGLRGEKSSETARDNCQIVQEEWVKIKMKIKGSPFLFSSTWASEHGRVSLPMPMNLRMR